ncbi:WAP four-disulfide core domain protein 2-like [Pomacea canaliculata]|uniref:WAP four-disulfide core domain protein 2-like n=1 Tax=Pomacea canaliculata TaxID=400727 RepID=UPI000D739660|nr:WAP four-disulfide core domain protein 2-like [Pomacea canaliculata]
MQRSTRCSVLWACAILCVSSVTWTDASNFETSCSNVRCPNGQVCLRRPGTSNHYCIRVAVTASTNQTFIPGSVEEEFGENERARSCPDPSQLPRSCVQQCRLHVDCQPNMACCSNGCGRICAAVSHRVRKPGSCPDTSQSLLSGPCQDTCRSDGDCAGVDKCCSHTVWLALLRAVLSLAV